MDSSKDEVIKKLHEIVNVVNLKNKMNLNDINSLCENLFCEILNIVYNYNLIVLNSKSNYYNIAVDLGDEAKRFYVQVTSNRKNEKINETLRKFSYTYAIEDKVVIFIIGEKPKYKKINKYGRNFNIDEDIWDINTIIDKLDDEEQNKRILLAINKFYDSGITDICSVYKKHEELTIEKTIIDSETTIGYNYGTGDVRISAFLPKSYKQKLSLLMMFRKKAVEDAWITFGQEDAENILFCSQEGSEVINRKFVLYEDDGKVWLQLLNIRFAIEYTVAENLCNILDDLKEEYIKCKKNQEKLLGIEKFNRDEQGDIVLAELPVYVWDAMFDFAQERDYGLPHDEWNMFHTGSFSRDTIRLYKNVHIKEKGDVLAEISCKRTYANYAAIVWNPGYTAIDNPCEEFDNKIKWKADYTCDWLINKFIPMALFEKEGKWYQTYNLFLKKYNPQDRGIYCLQGE